MSCSIASVVIYIVAFGLSFWSVVDYFFAIPIDLLRIWVYINFGLYFVELVLLMYMRSSLSIMNIIKYRNFENLFNLITGVFGVWGLIMTYNTEIDTYRGKNYNNSKTIMILKCMTWFRIIYVVIFGVFITCVGFMIIGVCVITICKGGNVKQEMKIHMGRRSSVMIAQRVPFLNNIVLNSSMFQLR